MLELLELYALPGLTTFLHGDKCLRLQTPLKTAHLQLGSGGEFEGLLCTLHSCVNLKVTILCVHVNGACLLLLE